MRNLDKHHNLEIGLKFHLYCLQVVLNPDWKVCTARAISCVCRNVRGFQPWPPNWQYPKDLLFNLQRIYCFNLLFSTANFKRSLT